MEIAVWVFKNNLEQRSIKSNAALHYLRLSANYLTDCSYDLYSDYRDPSWVWNKYWIKSFILGVDFSPICLHF